MKKFLAAAVSIILVLAALAGCGESFYYSYDINQYIKVGDYSNVVDRKSLEYFDALDEFYNSIFGTDLGYEAESGKVENGDLANIDYAGYLNGVAFDGGTATSYDLKIGSGNFIPGFEDGLIGVEIGDTVDINLTFPESYHSAELAGKAVVFTVTVNYVTKYAEPTEADAREYGFESLDDYNIKADEYAIKTCMFSHVYAATTFKKFPDKEESILYDGMMEYYEELCAQQGVTVEQLAQYNGMTLDQFKEVIREQYVRPSMKRDLVAAYILQINNQMLNESDVEDTIKRLESENDQDLKSLGYDRIKFEQEAAETKARNILYGQADIKN